MSDATPAQRKMYPELRVELDVTPRWFTPGSHFDIDHLALVTAFREGADDLRLLLVDFQVGLTGVRLVLAVPAGVTTDALDEARRQLVQVFDALDLVSPRRRAVTERRASSRPRRLQAVPEPPGAPEATPAPAEPVATPQEGGEGYPTEGDRQTDPITGTGHHRRSDPAPDVAVEA